MTKYYFILINGTKPIAAHYECTPITPKEFWETKHTLNPEDSIVLVCELAENRNGEEVNRTDFYGIEFAKELRRAGVKNKILFTSFCDRKYLSQDPRHTIINTVGHDFIQLPAKSVQFTAALKQIDDLSPESLLICQNSYCSKHGLINQLTHSLRSNYQITDNLHNDLTQVLEDIASIYNFLPPISEFNKQYTSLDESNIEEAINFVENYGEKIKSENPEVDSETTISSKPYAKHEILWLDDEACEDDLLYKTLSNEEGLNFKVQIVNTVENAKNIIEKDNLKRPNIMVAIVDYMLLETRDEVKVQQKEQGFDFIKWVTLKKFPLKILALSSMPRTLQNWLTESYGISTKSIPKKAINLNSLSGVNYVSEEIVKLANDNWMQINRKPTSAAWEKYLLPSYIQVTRDRNYQNIENEISLMALDWIHNYNQECIDLGNIRFKTNKYSAKTMDTYSYSGNSDKFFTNLTKSLKAAQRIKNPNTALNKLIDTIHDEIQLIAANITEVNINPDSLIADAKKEISNLKKEIKDQLEERLKELELKFTLSRKEKSTYDFFVNEHILPAIKAIRNQIESVEFSDPKQSEASLELDANNINFIKHVLAGRRVLLYLSIVKGLNQSNVSNVLGQTEYTTKQMFSTWAALKIEDFPIGLTIEEENWFARHFYNELALKGINLKNDIQNYYNSLLKISEFFSIYFQNSMLKELIQNEMLYLVDEKVVNFNHEYQPVFSNTDEIKNLMAFIVARLDIENQEEFYGFIILWRNLLDFIDTLMYKKVTNKELNRTIKIKNKRNLGNLYSLKQYLLNIEPKEYKEKLKELGNSSAKITIEDEYILLHNPIEHYFGRSRRVKKSFAYYFKNIEKIYLACFTKTKKELEQINNFKSGLYYKAIKKGLTLSEGSPYNLNPFTEISALSDPDKLETKFQVYKIISSYKVELNKLMTKLYKETKPDNTGFVDTDDSESTEDYSMDYWDLIPKTIKNQLKSMITNFDEYFPGLEAICNSLEKDINLNNLPIKEGLSQCENVIILGNSCFLDDYNLTNPELNKSSNSNLVILCLKN